MPLDPRANSAERLVAPVPLPHISRRALKRVKNPLPVPTSCRYCAGHVELINNSRIYGREFGEWPYAYRCDDCGAYVGLHPSTDIPLGTLATAQLRKDRNLSKAMFHKVKERRGLTRSLAYEWLAGKMGIPVGQCHFGWFDQDECAQAMGHCVDDLTAGTSMAKAFSKARQRA
ncbi:zinc-finger-containing protein [Pseudomonas chlororaphis]|uniref:zinc-finger-containing protein n=1 Tax=Pseudomonas chlororaphis TaxID=587753 RepID=UPI000F54F087|nr:zinc-finger-containing protein [Pseudomonas chlororaphis]AZD50539.1 Phage protein [Pseudomonas chlororaphis subsp. aurantiaca]